MVNEDSQIYIQERSNLDDDLFARVTSRRRFDSLDRLGNAFGALTSPNSLLLELLR